MVQRDPVMTEINKTIRSMSEELRRILPRVLEETGLERESSINAIIGGKAAEFIDLHHEVILSAEQYVTAYLRGFEKALSEPSGFYESAYERNYRIFKESPKAQEYFILFLKRSFLKHYKELTRVRPKLEQSQIWIGQNRAEYGLFITPRFKNGEWENDRSEIRHFSELYWTIGHILKTGLVVPGDEDKIEFSSLESYLIFFKNSLVRASGSPYERDIAARYVEYVRNSTEPNRVPLLIPEYRYEGQQSAHRYRLDFCIINPFTMQKIGYELSPWSTHGYLKKTKGLTQKQINEMAKLNFEKEMEKHRAYFKKHDIYILIYTDDQLKETRKIFEDMSKYLNPIDKVIQLDFHLMNSFFSGPPRGLSF